MTKIPTFECEGGAAGAGSGVGSPVDSTGVRKPDRTDAGWKPALQKRGQKPQVSPNKSRQPKYVGAT
jgi:hypothetical protein